MKNFILALALALTVAAVSAEPTVIVARGMISNQSGATAGTSSDSNAMKIVHGINGNTSADVLFVHSRNRSTDKNTMQYEFGLIQRFPINEYVTTYIRPNIGSIQPSGSDSLNYVGIEPGVIVRPFANAFSIKADYSWFTGINNSVQDLTMGRVALNYDVGPKTTVGVRKDWIRGDSQSETTWLALTHRF
jgi:hypothetical protein